jgi:hypothetical protein
MTSLIMFTSPAVDATGAWSSKWGKGSTRARALRARYRSSHARTPNTKTDHLFHDAISQQPWLQLMMRLQQSNGRSLENNLCTKSMLISTELTDLRSAEDTVVFHSQNRTSKLAGKPSRLRRSWSLYSISEDSPSKAYHLQGRWYRYSPQPCCQITSQKLG